MIGGRFMLSEVAGRGASSTVWRALDRATDAVVAVKILSDARRFGREVEVLSRVAGRGIVRVVAHGVDGGQPWLATEWLAGTSLRARSSSPGLTVAEAVTVIRHAAEAVALAHRAGVVHRDLKPEHVWLVDGALDDVRLLDFGIARTGHDVQLTRTGTTVGTPAYMAPEQARGAVLDARADVFALGAVLHELLTGAPPFAGRHVAAIQAKVLHAAPPALTRACPEAPPELVRLVTAMLAKDPAARPADGDAVARALAALPAIGAGPRRASSTSAGAATVACTAVGAAGFVIAAAGGGGTVPAEIVTSLGATLDILDGLAIAVLASGADVTAGARRADALAAAFHHHLGAPAAIAAFPTTAQLDDALEWAADAASRASLLAELAELGAAPVAAIQRDARTTSLLGSRAPRPGGTHEPDLGT